MINRSELPACPVETTLLPTERFETLGGRNIAEGADLKSAGYGG